MPEQWFLLNNGGMPAATQRFLTRLGAAGPSPRILAPLYGDSVTEAEYVLFYGPLSDNSRPISGADVPVYGERLALALREAAPGKKVLIVGLMAYEREEAQSLLAQIAEEISELRNDRKLLSGMMVPNIHLMPEALKMADAIPGLAPKVVLAPFNEDDLRRGANKLHWRPRPDRDIRTIFDNSKAPPFRFLDAPEILPAIGPTKPIFKDVLEGIDDTERFQVNTQAARVKLEKDLADLVDRRDSLLEASDATQSAELNELITTVSNVRCVLADPTSMPIWSDERGSFALSDRPLDPGRGLDMSFFAGVCPADNTLVSFSRQGLWDQLPRVSFFGTPSKEALDYLIGLSRKRMMVAASCFATELYPEVLELAERTLNSTGNRVRISVEAPIGPYTEAALAELQKRHENRLTVFRNEELLLRDQQRPIRVVDISNGAPGLNIPPTPSTSPRSGKSQRGLGRK